MPERKLRYFLKFPPKLPSFRGMDIRQGSPISTALQAVKRDLQNIAERAASIAGSSLQPNTPSTTSLAEDLIDIKQSSHGVKANLKVIQKLQEMEQAALDILA